MDLLLNRSYYNEGTNGTLTINSHFICFTIELPWQENQRKVSCIPEGKYQVIHRYSSHFNNHLLLLNVEKRTLILIHPANNALKELEGCIAPVSQLTGIGRGLYSQLAMEKILALCHRAFEQNEKVFLTIKSEKS